MVRPSLERRSGDGLREVEEMKQILEAMDRNAADQQHLLWIVLR